MNTELPDFIADSLHIETNLPFQWQLAEPGHALPDVRSNIATLQLIETLDEPVHSTDKERRGDELQRLEQKIDLALQLLGQLLARQSPAAMESRPVVLGCRGMAWQEATPLPAGQRIRLTLQLHPDAMPLCLGGESVSAAGHCRYNCQLRFDLADDSFRNLFEKWIFRQHRRSVARQRAGFHPGS